MTSWIPIPFLVVTAVVTVWAGLQHRQRLVYLFKPLSTLLVIAVALLSLTTPDAQVGYTMGITAGLVLSLGGDVALMFPSRRAFALGLVLFLLAHLVYVLAFTLPNGFHPADWVTGAVLVAIAAACFLYLKPGLGSMKGPVLVYILVICLMVHRALSLFFGEAFTPVQAWLASAGAVLFLISDLILAINRFRHPLKKERLGLLAYYAGQLLIALTASYF
jgi:uncharacterized membrane protein YhhN